MREKLFSKNLVTEQDYRACREEIRLCLEEVFRNQDDSEVTMLEIAVNEALTNSYKHGLGKGKRGQVSFSISLYKPQVDSKCLLIRIKDSGDGFDVENVRKEVTEKQSSSDEGPWENSGRGMFIMESIMDKVRYSAKGNSVLLVKNLKT